MVDLRAVKTAHQLETCPACGGTMRLQFDTYTCDGCEHFRQEPSLHDISERDGGHRKFCECTFCIERRALRTRITELDSKLTDQAPHLKGQLKLALNNLDESYRLSGAVGASAMSMAIRLYDAVVEAIGNRAPETIEEMPR
jgi:hypothetical protein